MRLLFILLVLVAVPFVGSVPDSRNAKQSHKLSQPQSEDQLPSSTGSLNAAAAVAAAGVVVMGVGEHKSQQTQGGTPTLANRDGQLSPPSLPIIKLENKAIELQGEDAAHSRMRRALCFDYGVINLLGTSSITIGSNLGLPNYTPYMSCTWDFVSPLGSQITVRFLTSLVETCCDKIFVRNGDASGPLFPNGVFSGDTIPGPFLSSSNKLRVDFQTDKNVQWSGFTAEVSYRFICSSGFSLTQVSASPSIIATGPPGATTYPANAACRYVLTAVNASRARITVQSFSTVAGTDTLRVTSGTTGNVFGVFSGAPVIAPIVSDSNQLILDFVSGASVSGAGFLLVFSSTNESATAYSPCTSVPPSVGFGTVTHCAGTLSGSSCTPTCEPGYTPINAIRCFASIWNATGVQCGPAPCDTAPYVPYSNTSACVGMRSGSQCFPVCDTGYTRSGLVTCTRGSWTGSARCEESPCSTTPASISFGTVTGCPNTVSGTTCAPVCETGYSLVGAYSCNRGTWSGFPVCRGNPCVHAAPGVRNGDTTLCRDTPSGSTCAPVCNQGYTVAGSYLCTAGAWNGSATCFESPCLDAPDIVNGDGSSCRNTSSGSRCGFVCGTGYTVNGVIACSLGSWTGSGFCAERDCTVPPPRISNSQPLTGCVNTPSRSRCPHSCNAGYEAAGFYLCSLGQWTGDPVCTALPCVSAPAAIARGSVSHCTNVNSSGVCVPVCDSGHQVTGSLTCIATVWTGSASCLPIPCSTQPPVIANSNVTVCQNGTRGVTCTTTCATGFELIGDYTCTGGSWTGSPVCQALPCTTVPALPSGSLAACMGIASGSSCAPSCNRGYLPRGTLTCLQGALQGLASCAPAPCLQPTVAFSDVPDCTNLASGSICDPTCNPGYTLTGQLQCDAGAWSGSASCSPSSCTTLPPASRNAILDTRCALTTHNGVCPASCSPGFNIAGAFVCQFGNWSGSVTCLPQPCSSNPFISRGQANNCVGTPSGSTCSYTCDRGYAPSGNLTCTLGVWSNPSCTPIPCPAITPVANANVDHCLDFSGGAICTPHCQPGFMATSSLECINGNWNGRASCTGLPCLAAPSGSLNGNVSHCVNMPSGAMCRAWCASGLTARTDVVCSLGQWVGSSTCEASRDLPAGASSSSSGSNSIPWWVPLIICILGVLLLILAILLVLRWRKSRPSTDPHNLSSYDLSYGDSSRHSAFLPPPYGDPPLNESSSSQVKLDPISHMLEEAQLASESAL